MNKINISLIEDINVARVKSDDGTAGAKKAFDKLESRMSGIKGRKMYGVFYLKTNEYFACVKLDTEYPDDMGFERSTIPGGKYAKKKIENWTSKTHEIAPTFNALVELCENNGYKIDQTRPSIEFFRSFRELVLMLPIK